METVLGAVLVGCCVGLPVLAWALAKVGLKRRRAPDSPEKRTPYQANATVGRRRTRGTEEKSPSQAPRIGGDQ